MRHPKGIAINDHVICDAQKQPQDMSTLIHLLIRPPLPPPPSSPPPTHPPPPPAPPPTPTPIPIPTPTPNTPTPTPNTPTRTCAPTDPASLPPSLA